MKFTLPSSIFYRKKWSERTVEPEEESSQAWAEWDVDSGGGTSKKTCPSFPSRVVFGEGLGYSFGDFKMSTELNNWIFLNPKSNDVVCLGFKIKFCSFFWLLSYVLVVQHLYYQKSSTKRMEIFKFKHQDLKPSIEAIIYWQQGISFPRGSNSRRRRENHRGLKVPSLSLVLYGIASQWGLSTSKPVTRFVPACIHQRLEKLQNNNINKAQISLNMKDYNKKKLELLCHLRDI